MLNSMRRADHSGHSAGFTSLYSLHSPSDSRRQPGHRAGKETINSYRKTKKLFTNNFLCVNMYSVKNGNFSDNFGFSIVRLGNPVPVAGALLYEF